MVLVDTSVWIDFLRDGDETLSHLLAHNQVIMHPMIIGELACGNLRNRSQLLELWQNLPMAVEANHTEALSCLDNHRLMGKGIGFVDLHLLASTLLTADTQLWTRDKRLVQTASEINIAFSQQS